MNKKTKRAGDIEAALIGLLADLRDYLDGNERDLDVIVEDIEREFQLAAAVQEARTGATVEPVE